jgi:tRNA pseudouridine55 synthase
LNGLLLIDKPAGPSSHDVVARVRRAIGQRHIGHAGTLDPAATGLLLLLIGQTTRLARFVSASAKEYEATIRLGFATDTHDATGEPIGPAHCGPWPTLSTIDRTLDGFRGKFLQAPPIFSAKKVNGRRSYRAARAARRSQPASAPPVAPAPVEVTVDSLDVTDLSGELLSLRLRCSPGFYVRALAHELGIRLGTGAHLSSLRRTGSGEWRVENAMGLDQVEDRPDAARQAVVPPVRILSGLPVVVLTDVGARRATHGVDLGPGDAEPGLGTWPVVALPAVRLLTRSGELLGLAEPARVKGLLHPSIVLG